MRAWPPVRVELRERDQPWTIAIYFAHAGDEPPLLGVELLFDRDEHLKRVADSEAGGDVQSLRRLFSAVPKYVEYARAEVAWNRGDRAAALAALRAAGRGRRGYSDEWYFDRLAEYRQLVQDGEEYPFKALAEMHSPIDKSQASRWVKEALRREKERERGR